MARDELGSGRSTQSFQRRGSPVSSCQGGEQPLPLGRRAETRGLDIESGLLLTHLAVPRSRRSRSTAATSSARTRPASLSSTPFTYLCPSVPP